jgi:hypothetical protein
VQASQTIASYWLPRDIVAFRRACPHVEIHFRIGNSAQMASAKTSNSPSSTEFSKYPFPLENFGAG